MTARPRDRAFGPYPRMRTAPQAQIDDRGPRSWPNLTTADRAHGPNGRPRTALQPKMATADRDPDTHFWFFSNSPKYPAHWIRTAILCMGMPSVWKVTLRMSSYGTYTSACFWHINNVLLRQKKRLLLRQNRCLLLRPDNGAPTASWLPLRLGPPAWWVMSQQ